MATEQTLPGASQGIVLSFDICSSTTLVEELVARHGEKRGAEAFGALLNCLFGRVIDRVHSQHGSAIGFAGDSLQCWFDGSAELDALCVAHAMRNIPLEVGAILGLQGVRHPLVLRTALCRGEGIRCVVGDPELLLLDLLVGSASARADAALRICEPGQILVGSEILAGLGNRVSIKRWIQPPWSDTFGELREVLVSVPARPWKLPAPIRGAHGRWVPRIVEDHVRSFGSSLFGAIREPAVIFLRFDGSVESSDARLELLRQWTGCVQRVLDDLGGTLLQVTSEAKGTYLYGAFGALSAHEDDSSRAVEAAEILSREKGSSGLVRGIGISRGAVFVGTYGSAERITLGVVGRDVHLAARLMELAKPGQVLVSDRVARESASFWFEKRGACSIRGFSESIQVHQLCARLSPNRGLLPRHARVPVIVGREKERLLMRQRLEALQCGRGGLILLQGEPGSGKSRLMQELWELAEARGIEVLSIAGHARAEPFLAWQRLMRRILGVDHLAPDAWASQIAVVAKNAGIPENHAILLNAVIGLSVPDHSSIRHMSPEGRAVRMRTLVSTLLRNVLRQTGKAALLIVEDAHWLDEGSAELVVGIVRDIPQILTVAAVRSIEGADSDFRNPVLQLAGERIRLNPLSPEELITLARAMLGVEEIAADIRDVLVECSCGNPFFAQEILADLTETHQLSLSAGVARMTSSGTAGGRPLPGSIHDLLISRIDRLPAEEQSTLRVASVAGLVFADQLVRQALGPEIEEQEVRRRLSSLHLRGVLDQPAEETHSFRHALVRDAVYSMLLEAQRARLHRTAADWLKTHMSGNLAPHLASIAYHLERAGDASEAVGFLVKAAEQAMSVFANDEAARQFGRAIELYHRHQLAIPPEVVARWELRAAEAQTNLLRYRTASQHLARGLSGLGHPVPKGTLRTIGCLFAQMLTQAAHRLLPARFMGGRKDDAERLLTVARALEGSVEGTYLLGERLLSYHHAFANLNIAEAAGPSPEMARAYAAVGNGMGFAGLHGLARAYFRRACDVARAFEHPPTQCYVEVFSALYTAGIGAWSECLPSLTRALSLADEIGDPRRLSDALTILVPSLCLVGRLAEASTHVEHLVQINLRGPYVRNLCESLYLRTVVAQLTGDREAAENDARRLTSALTAAPELADDVLLTYRLSNEAMLLLECQQWDRAVECARKAVAITRNQNALIFSSVWAFANIGCVLAAAARRQTTIEPGLRRSLRGASQSLNRLAAAFPVARPAALRLNAECLVAAGRLKQARAVLDRSAATATNLGLPIEASLSRLVTARIGPADADERDILLRVAREQLRELGCEHFLGSLAWMSTPYVR